MFDFINWVDKRYGSFVGSVAFAILWSAFIGGVIMFTLLSFLFPPLALVPFICLAYLFYKYTQRTKDEVN